MSSKMEMLGRIFSWSYAQSWHILAGIETNIGSPYSGEPLDRPNSNRGLPKTELGHLHDTDLLGRTALITRIQFLLLLFCFGTQLSS
jgi:hypothetical protein